MTMYPERASLGGLEMMEIFKLVSYSATPEQWKEWLRVPLEHTAARGNLDLFNKLLGAGANGSAGWRGCEGRTLLDAAIVGGNMQVVSTLLLAGAQPDVNVVSHSSKTSTLFKATVLGHEAVARRLVIAGANVNFVDPVLKRCVLNEASQRGQEHLVAELLIGGADPNRRNSNGASSLHLAAEEGFDGIVSTLLLKGADKDAVDAEGKTPLMRACLADEGRLSVVKTLLTAGIDASVRDLNGYSALEFAAKKGHGDVIGAIVGHGTDVNASDDSGFTALHTAARYDQAGAIDALIEAGADIEPKMHDGFTPLANAAYHSNGKAMLALLQHGTNVDVRDNDGETPLHNACLGRSEGLHTAVDLLLRWGSDETALNNDGESPAELLNAESQGVENGDDMKKPATQDEIERTRLLLSGAPADRTWRRRGWLVILHSRAEKAKLVSSCDSDGAAGAGLDNGRSCKEARKDTAGRQSNGADERGGAGGDTCWSDVALLTGLEMEGVFRMVVGFL